MIERASRESIPCPPICLLIFRDGEASGKHQLYRSATDPPAADCAASAGVRVAARCMGRARAESDSRGRHLRFRLVRRSQRVQLLVRRTDRAGRNRRGAGSARLARDAAENQTVTWAGTVGRGVATWIFLVGIVGLPYWIVLIPLHELLLGDELRRHLARSPALWFTFGSLAASHFWKAFRAGYDTMPDKELKQRARWDIYLLILRAIAMFIMAAHGLAFILVPLMALVLSYLEIWPERALGAVFGDPSRLWEYDPGGPVSSRRRP